MKIFRNRLLVTLVLTAIVSILASSGALAALRSPTSTATGTSVSGVSGFDRPLAAPMSGEPDIGQTGTPLGTKSLTYIGSGGSWGSTPWWWIWTSWLWASWVVRAR